MQPIKHPTLAIIIALLLAPQLLLAKTGNTQYSNQQIRINFSPRTPEQIAAFYEGRGFSKAMVNKLKQQCFITVRILNKSQHVIWLDLANWTFSNSEGEFKRTTRAEWKLLWKKMAIPLAHQSTFRWTLLPEELDFRPDEHEGGNITLPFTDKPFTLQAHFKTKADKSGKALNIQLNNIQCAR